MCGSGTFLIEAALMASQTPPGLMRIGESGFGFMRWLTHKSDAFHGYVRELEAGIKPLENHRFYGSDSDGKMVGIALRNIAKAGFDGLIDLKRGFAEELQPDASAQGPYRLVVCNPPYGERMGEQAALETSFGTWERLFGNTFPIRVVVFWSVRGLRFEGLDSSRIVELPCEMAGFSATWSNTKFLGVGLIRQRPISG